MCTWESWKSLTHIPSPARVMGDWLYSSRCNASYWGRLSWQFVVELCKLGSDSVFMCCPCVGNVLGSVRKADKRVTSRQRLRKITRNTAAGDGAATGRSAVEGFEGRGRDGLTHCLQARKGSRSVLQKHEAQVQMEN